MSARKHRPTNCRQYAFILFVQSNVCKASLSGLSRATAQRIRSRSPTFPGNTLVRIQSFIELGGTKDKNRFNVATLIYKVPDHQTMTMATIDDQGNLARVLYCYATVQPQALGD